MPKTRAMSDGTRPLSDMRRLRVMSRDESRKTSVPSGTSAATAHTPPKYIQYDVRNQVRSDADLSPFR